MLRPFSRIVDFYETHFYYIDVLIALVITAGIYYWEIYCPSYVAPKGQSELNDLFVTIASIAGTLIGFNIAAITFLASLIEKDRFNALRQNKKASLIWKCSYSLTFNLFVVLTICLLFLSYDFSYNSYNIISYLLIYFIAISVLRLFKITKIISLFISVIHS